MAASADLPARTESICPHCLRRVEARRIRKSDCVFLEKTCPTHGSPGEILLWKDAPYPYEQWSRQNNRSTDDQRDPALNCPYDCGLCPGHRQTTCTAVLEVTHQCNLRCPVCFAAAGRSATEDPDRAQIARMLQAVLDSSGPCPVQLSGGEPTLRDDLPEIVALARSMGFDHVQVNTNGIRLAGEADYGKALKDAGVSAVFLQFDGLTDDVHIRIRGAALSGIKNKALDRCSDLKLGVILVPTLVRGINDGKLGDMIRFAKERIPTVKGVHFQPMAHLGRYPAPPHNGSRILIPHIIAAIEEQTGGELKAEHFMPPGCEEPHCSFSASAILDDAGNLVPTTRFALSRDAESCCSSDAAQKSRDYVRSRWRYRDAELPMIDSKSAAGCLSCQTGFLDRARSHSLCVSGMAFQDVWNIDLERLQRCCVHAVTPDAKLVPFCAYYLTGAQGQRLYGQKIKSS